MLGFDAFESFAFPSSGQAVKLGCKLTSAQHQQLAKKKIALPPGKKLKKMFTGCMVQENKRHFLPRGLMELPRGRMCKI